ncbi:predicted protein [Naegleria gruberi]|uniref:Predicted protein n=1 Tax=Naegleria gruberi TaxID=5762 RepID=D2VE38_NAEGR|nr:uncharacterized protein NAEGRDRAFT_67140 [Naegleria gruberi]EFC45101.1 predicted protein [Naegleria gruberi]|eukprot:XP_002677845.1 predicted protein [Naegleria gruberi strain NEG-M]
MLLGLLGCIVLCFMLPINILLSDTCNNLENYIIESVDSYGINATLKFEASFYKYNISFNTDLHGLSQTYLLDCKNDQISDLLSSIKFIVDDSPNLVSSLISSLGTNVKIRPALVKSIQDTIYSLMNNLYTSLMQVASLVTCKTLNTKYGNIKNLVCQDGSYFISTFWFLFALLTFLILINIAVYITIYVVFRYFWYDTKIVVKSNILSSADRSVILGNEHRIHHHHVVGPTHHSHHSHTSHQNKNIVRRVQNVVIEKELRDSTGGIILEDI